MSGFTINTSYNSFDWAIQKFDKGELPIITASYNEEFGVYDDQICSRGVLYNASGINEVTLSSNFYLLKTANTPYDKFKEQYDYIQSNIQHVWSGPNGGNPTPNQALARTRRSDPNSTNAGTTVDKITTLIRVFCITESQLRYLNEGDILVIVDYDPSAPRASASGLDEFNQRTVELF